MSTQIKESDFDALIDGKYYWIKYQYSDTPEKWVIGEWYKKTKWFNLTNRSVVTHVYVTALDPKPIEYET